jgi:hypothetical protein
MLLSTGCAEDSSGSTSGGTTGGTGGAGGTTSTGGAGPATGGGGSAPTSSSSTGGAGGGGCIGEFDPMEPNDSEQTANVLVAMPIEDCDDMGGNALGIIVGASDVDWYVYSGSDELGCSVDPTRMLMPDAPGLRMCKYFDCPGADVSCPNGTTIDTSPDGLDGCCSDTGFTAGVDCNGISDDADVYIRIDQPGGDAETCNGYNMAYHY